jgi:hypothetical protein
VNELEVVVFAAGKDDPALFRTRFNAPVPVSAAAKVLEPVRLPVALQISVDIAC